jgi:hypothetical protein
LSSNKLHINNTGPLHNSPTSDIRNWYLVTEETFDEPKVLGLFNADSIAERETDIEIFKYCRMPFDTIKLSLAPALEGYCMSIDIFLICPI